MNDVELQESFEKMFSDGPQTQLEIAERKIIALELEKNQLIEQNQKLKNRIVEIRELLKQSGIDL